MNFALHFTLRLETKIRCNGQLSVCQGNYTCIYIGFWQGPFPKSGLDKMSVFSMIGLGSFYCTCIL